MGPRELEGPGAAGAVRPTPLRHPTHPRSPRKRHSCPDLLAHWPLFPCTPGEPCVPSLPSCSLPILLIRAKRAVCPRFLIAGLEVWDAAGACPEGGRPRMHLCLLRVASRSGRAISPCQGWVGPCLPPLNCRPTCEVFEFPWHLWKGQVPAICLPVL